MTDVAALIEGAFDKRGKKLPAKDLEIIAKALPSLGSDSQRRGIVLLGFSGERQFRKDIEPYLDSADPAIVAETLRALTYHFGLAPEFIAEIRLGIAGNPRDSEFMSPIKSQALLAAGNLLAVEPQHRDLARALLHEVEQGPGSTDFRFAIGGCFNALLPHGLGKGFNDDNWPELAALFRARYLSD